MKKKKFACIHFQNSLDGDGDSDGLEKQERCSRRSLFFFCVFFAQTGGRLPRGR